LYYRALPAFPDAYLKNPHALPEIADISVETVSAA
jgi:hypothetical protein